MTDLSWFDASSVPPVEDYGLIPSGEYTAAIEASEMKDNSKGDGKFLKLTIQILDGPYKSRKLWEYLNLINQSAKAQEIARGTLSAICRAVGVLNPRDSSDLHNRPLKIRVGVEIDKGTGEQRNRIKAWATLDGSTMTMATVPQNKLSPAQNAMLNGAKGLTNKPDVVPPVGGDDMPF